MAAGARPAGARAGRDLARASRRSRRRDRSRSRADLVVHEWGTFLAMNGSDGVGLDGMYHEEHALPGFVHARSRDQLRLPSVVAQGGDARSSTSTPTGPEGPRRRALPARHLDAVVSAGPDRRAAVRPDAAPDRPAGRPHPLVRRHHPGRARRASPCRPPRPTPSGTSPATSTPRTSARPDCTRGPDATETERFLFYRGLGRASLPLGFSAAEGGTSRLAPRRSLRRRARLRPPGRGRTRAPTPIDPHSSRARRSTGVIPSGAEAKPLAEFASDLADDLAARLVESGLYRQGGPRDGQHLAIQLLPDARASASCS